MNGRQSVIAFLVSGILLLGQMMPASATTLTLDTGKNLEIDPAVSTTGTFTLSATNDSGSVINTFNGWGLILQLVPTPGAIGTAAFVNLTEPAVNPSLGPVSNPPDNVTTTFDDTYFLLSSINGTTDAYFVGIGNETDSATTWSLGQALNLADLEVQLSPGAQGTWTVFAINDRFNSTGWFDMVTFESIAFSDLPTAPVTNPQSYTSLTLGTITAVPEPSTLMLAGSAIVAAGWFGWRSRRQPTVVEA
jgi:hypothetical protein